MRQAGYMAAAGIYALENNIKRLEQDHLHAGKIAEALSAKEFTDTILPVETNIIIFSVKAPYSNEEIARKLKEENILLFTISATQIRMVLHLDITPTMVDHIIDVINRL